MQKTKLNRFIQKYNLNGNVNSFKWTSKNNTLSTTFVTSDKTLMGFTLEEKTELFVELQNKLILGEGNASK